MYEIDASQSGVRSTEGIRLGDGVDSKNLGRYAARMRPDIEVAIPAVVECGPAQNQPASFTKRRPAEMGAAW